MRLTGWIAALGLLLVAACATAEEPEVPVYRGQIAISFDDAPRGQGPVYTGAERTQVLLGALEAVDSGPVVFFVTTDGFDDEVGGRERVLAYAEAGHLIANHTHTHPWLSRIGAGAYLADVDVAAARLDGFANWRAWFRYPYLDEGRDVETRDAVRAGLAERGLVNGYVTIDTYDWYVENRWMEAVKAGRSVDVDALGQAYVDMALIAVEFYDEVAVELFGETVPHVLLLHENDLAAMFIDDLIAALRADGWEVISPDLAYAAPMAAMIPQTLSASQGRVAALAFDAGRPPPTMTHLYIEEEQIDALLAERGVFGSAPE